MSTAFANSRFLVPWIAKGDWALFADGADMLFADDPAKLFELADPKYAVQVVKRAHVPTEQIKMDQQIQTSYPMKNWSSLVLWNLRHPAHKKLTLEDVNTKPGRDLHRFFWLSPNQIGGLPISWNYLAGIDAVDGAPQLIHYTLGTPEVGVDGPFADAWHRERSIMDAWLYSRLAA